MEKKSESSTSDGLYSSHQQYQTKFASSESLNSHVSDLTNAATTTSTGADQSTFSQPSDCTCEQIGAPNTQITHSCATTRSEICIHLDNASGDFTCEEANTGATPGYINTAHPPSSPQIFIQEFIHSMSTADSGPIPRENSRASMGARTSDSWIVLDETGGAFSRASSRASDHELSDFSESYAQEMLPIRRTPDGMHTLLYSGQDYCYDSLAQAEQSLGLAMQRESNLGRLGSPFSIATDNSIPEEEIRAAAAAAAAARSHRYGDRSHPFLGVMMHNSVPIPLSPRGFDVQPNPGATHLHSHPQSQLHDATAWSNGSRRHVVSRSSDEDTLSSTGSRRNLDRGDSSSILSSPHFQRGEKSDKAERRRQRRECRAKLGEVVPDSTIWISWISFSRVIEFLSTPLFVSHFCVLTFGVMVGRSNFANRALMYII